MARLSLLILSVFGTLVASGAVLGATECSQFEINAGTCITATVDSDEVRLEGLESPRGSTPTAPPGEDPETAPEISVSTGPNGNGDPLSDCADPLSTSCIRPYIATVTAPVTLADIAAFRPSPAVDHMEPNGWTVAGLATNFYATGGVHIRDGMLLGQQASVRFTPVEWHWSYGDGTAASHPQPGAAWAAQGVPEFAPTGTSHVYERYGTYYVDLVVDFAAEYRFAGGPWVGIAGTLAVPADRLVITAGSAKTVLVDRECTRNPAGPGC